MFDADKKLVRKAKKKIAEKKFVEELKKQAKLAKEEREKIAAWDGRTGTNRDIKTGRLVSPVKSDNIVDVVNGTDGSVECPVCGKHHTNKNTIYCSQKCAARDREDKKRHKKTVEKENELRAAFIGKKLLDNGLPYETKAEIKERTAVSKTPYGGNFILSPTEIVDDGLVWDWQGSIDYNDENNLTVEQQVLRNMFEH